LQTDGYAAYDRVGGEKIVRAACWAHARRKFIEVLKLSPKDVAAMRIVAAMDALFAVDACARELGIEERQRLRIEKSQPLLEGMREELKKLQRESLPASALGKAATYTLSLWPKLVSFLKHAELELSNHLAENSMRGVALGRKKDPHWHEKAGPKVAAILSVVESCRRLGVPARTYLADILPGLSACKIQDLAGRMPAAWVKSKVLA